MRINENNNRKRITAFIASLASGGAEHQMSILVSLLHLQNYNVTLVTFGDTDDHYKVPEGIKRVRLAERKSTFKKVISIMRFFLKVDTDCVISFAQRTNFLCLIPLLFRKNIKVIASERNRTIGKSDFKERTLFKCLYKRASFIVPNSYSQGQYICSKQPSLAKKIKPIINYTDLDQFSVSPVTMNEVYHFGIFARFEAQKNCIRFVEVLAELKRSVTHPFVVDWYGNSKFSNPVLAGYVSELKGRIKDLGLEKDFIMHDPVKNPAELMSQFDAICLPSIFEGFSNSVAEGIASGKPMIVSDVSDNSVMVHDGENGYLFDPNDSESMLNAFLRFFSSSKDEIASMGHNSRQIAEKLFSSERFIDAYINLIEN